MASLKTTSVGFYYIVALCLRRFIRFNCMFSLNTAKNIMLRFECMLASLNNTEILSCILDHSFSDTRASKPWLIRVTRC